jgi:hypothetical protein
MKGIPVVKRQQHCCNVGWLAAVVSWSNASSFKSSL